MSSSRGTRPTAPMITMTLALAMGGGALASTWLAATQWLGPGGTRPPTIEPAFLLDGAGRNIDSLAFWEAPNPRDTLLLVTAKANQLVEVWQYPFLGRELAPLRHARFRPGSQVNGIAVDQETDRAYVTVSRPVSTVVVFDLPARRAVDELLRGARSLGSEPNLALLRDGSGSQRAFVSADSVVYVLDVASGRPVGQFTPTRGLETIAADRHHGVLYIPDENDRTGVYAYRPDGRPFVKAGRRRFGTDRFADDAEGIIIRPCGSSAATDDGQGIIVVAEQLDDRTEFEIFDRSSWRHLGVFHLSGVGNTDGIASTTERFAAYPEGLFVAVDDDSRVAGVGWDRIFEATGVTCLTPAVE